LQSFKDANPERWHDSLAGALNHVSFKLASEMTHALIQGGKLQVANDEPLRRELVDFVDAVRHRRDPGVTGQAGRAALELATRIAEKMKQ